MPRGGKRAGAGRKAGALTQRTRALAERATADGMTPIDYMLGVMRDPAADLARRDDMAKAAAPYVHPKLAAVEHSGGLELTTQTKEQRDAAVAAATRADS
jgi:hypothetical protein